MDEKRISEAVLHVSDDPADLERALDTAAALRAALPALHVRVIVNGPALAGMSGTAPIAPGEGVEVAACAVGLGRRGIDRDALRPGIETVPAASVALVEAQLAGAAYIRI